MNAWVYQFKKKKLLDEIKKKNQVPTIFSSQEPKFKYKCKYKYVCKVITNII